MNAILILLGAVDDDGKQPEGKIEQDDAVLPRRRQRGRQVRHRHRVQVRREDGQVDEQRAQRKAKVEVGGPVFGPARPGIAVHGAIGGADDAEGVVRAQEGVEGCGDGDECADGEERRERAGDDAQAADSGFEGLAVDFLLAGITSAGFAKLLALGPEMVRRGQAGGI
jgi:hypothetical protein